MKTHEQIIASFREKRILNRMLAWAVTLPNQDTGFGSLLPTADLEVDKFFLFTKEVESFILDLLKERDREVRERIEEYRKTRTSYDALIALDELLTKLQAKL